MNFYSHSLRMVITLRLKFFFRIVSVAHIFLIVLFFLFKVSGQKCEGKESRDVQSSEEKYETSINQEKQEDLRSHKDSLADTDAPMNLNVSQILS